MMMASLQAMIDEITAHTETIILGLKYETGPHTIGLMLETSEAQDTAATGDTEGEAVMIAHSYSMGGGVNVSTGVTFYDFDDEGTDDSDGIVGLVTIDAGF